MNIVLLANGRVGLNVCNFLKKNGEKILALVLPDQGSSFDEEIMLASQLPASDIYFGNINKNFDFINKINAEKPFIIITCYWPWLLEKSVFQDADKTVNFHPAPLPINRGWYPHVHSILDGSPAGVTLHVIDEDADTGPIWAQKILETRFEETAWDIYVRLQDEIFHLFSETWEAIKSGGIEPIPQDLSEGNYHKKKEIDDLDFIDLNRTYKAVDLINLLRARSFGDKGFSYCLDSGQKVYLNLGLSREK